jgi:hypothetical protein
MIRFIENIGDYFSQHFFNEDFPKKVFDKSGYVTQKKDDDNVPIENHITTINSKVAPLREKYFRFKNEFLNIQRTKDRVKLAHDFHAELLKTLDYKNGIKEYDNPVYLNENEVVPVRYQYYKGDRPYLFVMEMQAMIKEGDDDPQGIFDQVYLKDDWEKVFPEEWKDIQIKPDVINEALTELFILPEEERPEYVIMLAAPKIFLIHYEKWKYDSFLLFNLEELFTESQVPAHKDYLSLFYALLSKPQFISETDSILHVLEEDAHKAMYGVTQALKNSVIYAVESLANEAIYYKLSIAKSQEEKANIEQLMASDTFARELKDECLTFVYRLLFLFYAESREDLEILPVKDTVYQKGYSLEMLRDLEMVPLTSDSARNGNFFSQSLWKLFTYLHKGQENENGFIMKPLDSPLFDNETLRHLKEVEFRNYILQEIIVRLSLSERTKNKGRGRISYSNLGINQLGSVYESLLAYSGFFAAETLIEVKAADDNDGNEGTFLVPKKRRDDFLEDEILKDPEFPDRDMEIEKGKFVYRLNGRDRKKTASYYTPEVLTQTTVKYTLKGILDKLKERQGNDEDCADEILKLKILEPAMGAAAFQNEVINQLAVAYLEFKENEVVRSGGKRIIPGRYKDELQKVKAFIASHNVYGVDLNTTAIELGKLSLWLNCMHKDMETPFFAHRLGSGNAVVGAWLKVYSINDIITEFPKEGTTRERKTPIPKDWWNKAPQRVSWKNNKLERKQDQVYHFLLPDANMVPSATIKLLKLELSEAEIRSFNSWKKEFISPIRGDEHIQLKRICNVIDVLLEEHYQQTERINRETASHYNLFGQTERTIDFKNYKEKERLAKLRNDRSAPYYKLKTIMDYWCSLWFWDVRRVADLPTREQWYNEVESILGLDIERLSSLETTVKVGTGFEQSVPEQQNLFGGPKQMSLGSKPKISDQSEKIKQLIATYSNDPSRLYQLDRIKYVQGLSDSYRFFHNELEFIEIFRLNGGFDIIVGNPPWVRIRFEEKDVMSDIWPEIIIRKQSSSLARKDLKSYLESENNKRVYLDELLDFEGTGTFLNAMQNFPLMEDQSQAANLFKCIISNSFECVNKNGFIGLIHPESIYDDPNGQIFRHESYQRLRFHFQFVNTLKLFQEILHWVTYSLNVYQGKKQKIDFLSMNNLYHPSTISLSFIHNGEGSPGGLKKKDVIKGGYTWNIDPHIDRIIRIEENSLRTIAKAFENSNLWESVRLVSIHCNQIINVLEKLSEFKNKLSDKDFYLTDGWRETDSLISGSISKQTKYPEYENYEMIYSGPHFYVSCPFFKNPILNCKKPLDYDTIDLNKIESGFWPRTNFLPAKSTTEFRERFFWKQKNIYWIDRYKVGFSKMLSLTGERTFQPVLLPPKVSHNSAVISLCLEKEKDNVELVGICSSIIMDFYIKTLGRSNLYESTIKNLLIQLPVRFSDKLIFRTLILNCLNDSYSTIWHKLWDDRFKNDCFFRNDHRVKVFEKLNNQWNWESPLRNWYERRLALIEIDVLVSIALNLTLDQLLLIYELQFPVLQQNEADTWYDQKGNIVFTCSKGLTGVGLDRSEWEQITKQSNPFQRILKTGDSYEHINTKSELYYGNKIIYYAPFDKCNRVEDYRMAWKHFEKELNENK